MTFEGNTPAAVLRTDFGEGVAEKEQKQGS